MSDVATQMMSLRRLVLPLPKTIGRGQFQGWSQDAFKCLGPSQRKRMGWPFLTLDVRMPHDVPGAAMDLATLGVWIETFLRHQGVFSPDDVVCDISLSRTPSVAGCAVAEVRGYQAMPSYLAMAA